MNFSNQHLESLTKYRPAWNICSQHSDYQHSGPLHDIMQQIHPLWISMKLKYKFLTKLTTLD